MDGLCTGVILIVVLLVVWFLLKKFMGAQDKPQGTYNDKKIQSGGSIGKQNGGRAYDHKKVDSGGSFGGDRERRAYDHPDVESGGSIGGGPRAGSRPGSASSSSADDGWSLGGSTSNKVASSDRDSSDDGPRKDHPKIRSGGSFGG